MSIEFRRQNKQQNLDANMTLTTSKKINALHPQAFIIHKLKELEIQNPLHETSEAFMMDHS